MTNIEVKFKKLHENALIPEAKSVGAGAMDVTCTEIVKKEGYMCCKLGFATDIPAGYRAICVPRSGITKTGWILANGVGVIDSDYRGEWELRFIPVPKGLLSNYDELNKGTIDGEPCEIATTIVIRDFPYQVGDRVGQIFLEKVINIAFTPVDELEDSARGTGGFGSTGTT